jgi:hypothetical protein
MAITSTSTTSPLLHGIGEWVSSAAKGNALEKRVGSMLEARARQQQIGKTG